MILHLSMFAKVALYRRGSFERCCQLMVTPLSGNGTLSFDLSQAIKYSSKKGSIILTRH
jgi:hypothetical protein